MRIEDLMKVLTCGREKALQRVNVFVGYMLFRAKLCGSDIIPGVGEVSVSKDNKEVVIKLDQKWVDLLEGKSCESEILEYLMRLVK